MWTCRSVSVGQIRGSGVAGGQSKSVFDVLRNSQTVSHSGSLTILRLHQQPVRVFISLLSPDLVLSGSSCPAGCEVGPHCGFDLLFLGE